MAPFPRFVSALDAANVRFLVIGVAGINHYAQTAGVPLCERTVTGC
jgi:hypothetical protein